MIVVTVFSITLPVQEALIRSSVSATHEIAYAFDDWLVSGLILVPAAAISIGFGIGRLRWLGLLAATATAVYVLIAIVSSS
jgi:hypothetical protein